MTAFKDFDARDKVVVWVAGVVGLFLILSLAAVFVLEVMGRDTGETWGRVFDLVGVLAGGLVGFIAGAQVTKYGSEPEPVPVADVLREEPPPGDVRNPLPPLVLDPADNDEDGQP